MSDSTMMISSLIFIFISILRSCAHAASLSSNSRVTVNRTKKETAELTWTVKLSKKDPKDVTLRLIDCYAHPRHRLASGTDQIFGSVQDNYIGDRLKTGFDHGKRKYTLKISKVEFADQKQYYCQYELIRLSTMKTFKRGRSNVSLTVEGGPEKCGEDLSQPVTEHEGTTAKFTLNLCGNPAPSMDWIFDNDTTTTIHGHKTKNTSMYTYSIEFPALTRQMCGKRLNYTAHGGGRPLKDARWLRVRFKPSVVQNLTVSGTKFNSNKSVCVRSLSWIAPDIGNCSLSYEVHVYNNEDLVQGLLTINSTVNDFMCYTTRNPEHTKITVRARIDDTYGDWCRWAYVTYDRESTSMKTMLIVLIPAVSAILLLLLVAGIIRSKKGNRKKSHSKKGLKDQNSNRLLTTQLHVTQVDASGAMTNSNRQRAPSTPPPYTTCSEDERSITIDSDTNPSFFL